MPNTSNYQPFYVGQAGSPDTYQEIGAGYAPGELGTNGDWNDRSYQRVFLDSGATSATPAGAVAANQLAYWKNRSTYTVTNDSRFGFLGATQTALSQRNNVAGIFRAAIVAGSACFVLQRGRQINVKEVGSATAGMTLIASTSTTAADALGVAINTAPNCLTLGVVYTATAANVCVADVDIAPIP